MNTHIATSKCNECGNIIESKHGGDFIMCSCGKSYIDQERFSALYVRTSNAELIEQICPKDCHEEEHKNNKKAE